MTLRKLEIYNFSRPSRQVSDHGTALQLAEDRGASMAVSSLVALRTLSGACYEQEEEEEEEVLTFGTCRLTSCDVYAVLSGRSLTSLWRHRSRRRWRRSTLIGCKWSPEVGRKWRHQGSVVLTSSDTVDGRRAAVTQHNDCRAETEKNMHQHMASSRLQKPHLVIPPPYSRH